jgi:hypothetical protein
MTHTSFIYNMLLAGIVAGLLAGVIVLAAASLGWLVNSQVLAGALAMVVSSILIIGYGGMSSKSQIVVGLLWGFSYFIFDKTSSMPGWIEYIVMAAAYLVLGIIPGKSRLEVLYGGSGPVVAAIIGIILLAVIFPQTVRDGFDETLISAVAISAGRTSKMYITSYGSPAKKSLQVPKSRFQQRLEKMTRDRKKN